MIKKCIFTSILCIAMTFSLGSISFADLMNHDSALWHAVKGQSFTKRMEIVSNYGDTQEATTTLKITDVPNKDGKITDLTLTIKNNGLLYDVACYDALDMNFKGQLFEEEALLVLLFGGNLCQISGTTALHIWEALWILCGCKKGTLEDASSIDGFKLRYLLPYICGVSWFGKYRYHSTVYTQEKYAHAVAALANRTGTMIQKQCSLDDCIIINDALDFCRLPASAPIGELIKQLYNYWRFGDLLSEQDRIRCKEWLLHLYKNVIKNKSFDSITEQMYPVLKHADLEKMNPMM